MAKKPFPAFLKAKKGADPEAPAKGKLPMKGGKKGGKKC